MSNILNDLNNLKNSKYNSASYDNSILGRKKLKDWCSRCMTHITLHRVIQNDRLCIDCESLDILNYDGEHTINKLVAQNSELKLKFEYTRKLVNRLDTKIDILEEKNFSLHICNQIEHTRNEELISDNMNFGEEILKLREEITRLRNENNNIRTENNTIRKVVKKAFVNNSGETEVNFANKKTSDFIVIGKNNNERCLCCLNIAGVGKLVCERGCPNYICSECLIKSSKEITFCFYCRTNFPVNSEDEDEDESEESEESEELNELERYQDILDELEFDDPFLDFIERTLRARNIFAIRYPNLNLPNNI